MPERSFTIASYAAAGSLAAATLVYVFGPSLLDRSNSSARNDKKRIALGLRNQANDCFINSTLQALAGLPSLHLYLHQTTHQRQIGDVIYSDLSEASEEQDRTTIEGGRPEWLQLSLQNAVLTKALKRMLDALEERSTSKRTISAQPFITAVEQAFRTRVSRYQQDAQEFLQLILERVADEHNAGRKVRRRAESRRNVDGMAEADSNLETQATGLGKIGTLGSDRQGSSTNTTDRALVESVLAETEPTSRQNGSSETLTPTARSSAQFRDYDLPFEGKIGSQIECQTCHFKPRPAVTTFVTLTLNVPQGSNSTTLDACLDGILKVEHIDDFRCDRCRLDDALQAVTKQLERHSVSAEDRVALEQDKNRIETALNTDPEKPPKGLKLPDATAHSKRRISRHMRISTFPKILAIHLSRSVWDSHSTSWKNMAKVSFPEMLRLGGLLDRRSYKLLAVITHRGGHNSGHYESFRRQLSPTETGVEEQRTSSALDASSNPLSSEKTKEDDDNTIALANMVVVDTNSKSGKVDLSPESDKLTHATSEPLGETNAAQHPNLKAATQAKIADKIRKAQDRWWRISDDKVKECKLSDVLGMQREVYILFYELVTS